VRKEEEERRGGKKGEETEGESENEHEKS